MATSHNTDSQIDRDFPYQVEIPAPRQGLGTRLDEMHRFCRVAEFSYFTRAHRTSAGDLMTWYFERAEDAEAFRMKFEKETARDLKRTA
jgi:hypothetical protein